MCRMFGMKNFNYIKHKELMENFFKLAKFGKKLKGDTSGHTDGWGIGYYKGNNAIVYKSANSVIEEEDIFFAKLAEIGESRILILHFRKSAWQGTNSQRNSQPFKYKNILFAHNGTIYNYKKLFLHLKMPAIQPLDSETYFLYMVQRSHEGIEDAFKNSISEIKRVCKYSSLTCLFTDGNNLYGWRDYTKSPEYYTLYYSKINGSGIISSEPVLDKLNWKLLRKNQLLKL